MRLSMTFQGYNGANDKLFTSYHARKPFPYIIYFTAHNLYGHPMIQLLPTEILDWVNPKDFNINNYYNDIPIG